MIAPRPAHAAAGILIVLALLFAHAASAATTITIRFDDTDARSALEAMRAAPDRSAADEERARTGLRELRRDGGRLQVEVAQRLSAMLPTGTDFKATVRVLGPPAGRRESPADPGVVPLSLADYVRPGEVALDVNALFAGTVRGVYRVAFRAAGGPPPRPAVDSVLWEELSAAYGPEVVGEVWRHAGGGRWNGTEMRLRLEAWVPPATWTRDGLDRFVALLVRMQQEGTGVLAAAAPRGTADPNGDPAGVESWAGTVRTDWPVLEQATSVLEHGGTGDEIDRVASSGFAPDGPLVRLGYRMAKRIDARTGRRTLVAATGGGPIAFVEAYLATHPDGPEHMAADTERVLRAVIREIRAVGAFRPPAGPPAR